MKAGKSLTFVAERTGAYVNDVSGPKQAVDDKNGFLLVARSSAGEVRGVLVKP